MILTGNCGSIEKSNTETVPDYFGDRENDRTKDCEKVYWREASGVAGILLGLQRCNVYITPYVVDKNGPLFSRGIITVSYDMRWSEKWKGIENVHSLRWMGHRLLRAPSAEGINGLFCYIRFRPEWESSCRAFFEHKTRRRPSFLSATVYTSLNRIIKSPSLARLWCPFFHRWVWDEAGLYTRSLMNPWKDIIYPCCVYLYQNRPSDRFCCCPTSLAPVVCVSNSLCTNNLSYA